MALLKRIIHIIAKRSYPGGKSVLGGKSGVRVFCKMAYINDINPYPRGKSGVRYTLFLPLTPPFRGVRVRGK